MDYILDTNFALIYARNNNVTKRLEQKLNLMSGNNRLIVSIVTVGEVRAIAKKNGWGEKKTARLFDLITDFIIAGINVEGLIESYAEIDAFNQGKTASSIRNRSSRNMGKNDLWISTTAAYLNVELITTDKDFDHLNAVYFPVNRIVLAEV